MDFKCSINGGIMKKFLGILISIILIFVLLYIFNNKKIDKYFTFKSDDIVTIWVFYEGKKGLSYNYKLTSEAAANISYELLNSKRKIIKSTEIFPKKEAISIDIFLDGKKILHDDGKGEIIQAKREVGIVPKDDKSVYVFFTDKRSKFMIVQSKWLVEYLDSLKKLTTI